jgi:hypothetical protein
LYDRQGNIWVSTVTKEGQGMGLVQAVPVHSFFRHYLTENDSTGNTDIYFAVLSLIPSIPSTILSLKTNGFLLIVILPIFLVRNELFWVIWIT